jgi:hypothetical protein
MKHIILAIAVLALPATALAQKPLTGRWHFPAAARSS